ncbi:MAG: hypothetical protein R6W76_03325, partial [Caldilinea sp.]
MNERTFGWGENDAPAESMWLLRVLRWMGRSWRPYLGWTVLVTCLLLAMLPAALLWENRWLRSAPLILRLYLAGPLAIVMVWLVGGWRRPLVGRRKVVRVAIQSVLLVFLSVMAISQLIVGWMPGPVMLWQAAVTGAWSTLALHAVDAVQGVVIRYALWWQGVQNNTAGRDDLVFFGFALVIVWLLSLVTGWLVRRRRNGLLA